MRKPASTATRSTPPAALSFRSALAIHKPSSFGRPPLSEGGECSRTLHSPNISPGFLVHPPVHYNSRRTKNMDIVGHFSTSMHPAGETPAPPESTRFPIRFPTMSAPRAHRPLVTRHCARRAQVVPSCPSCLISLPRSIRLGAAESRTSNLSPPSPREPGRHAGSAMKLKAPVQVFFTRTTSPRAALQASTNTVLPSGVRP